MKNILLAVSSGIACYKALDLCSLLKKDSYNVTVLMTEKATKLISPQLFQVISQNKVYYNLFDENDINVSHIDLTKKADLIIVVPATANIISKIASGIADDFVSTTILASNYSKLIIAPAMNTNMYNNPIVQDNLKKIEKLGASIINPDEGLLACGDIGIGKLADINRIKEYIDNKLMNEKVFENKKILITAGGTREYIDPVRFIGNSSSGKMGYALAEEAINLGADVTLISTTNLLKKPSGLKRYIEVNSADEMYEKCMELANSQDYIIKTAAVSDFKIKNYSNTKLKKENIQNNLNLELELNKDILLELSKIKNRKFKLIGFAAESDNLEFNALKKLERKNIDYIILNDISDKNIGFNSDFNKVTIYDRNKNKKELDLNTKKNIAKEILKYIV